MVNKQTKAFPSIHFCCSMRSARALVSEMGCIVVRTEQDATRLIVTSAQHYFERCDAKHARKLVTSCFERGAAAGCSERTCSS